MAGDQADHSARGGADKGSADYPGFGLRGIAVDIVGDREANTGTDCGAGRGPPDSTPTPFKRLLFSLL